MQSSSTANGKHVEIIKSSSSPPPTLEYGTTGATQLKNEVEDYLDCNNVSTEECNQTALTILG